MGLQGGLTHEPGSTFPLFPHGNALGIYMIQRLRSAGCKYVMFLLRFEDNSGNALGLPPWYVNRQNPKHKLLLSNSIKAKTFTSVEKRT